MALYRAFITVASAALLFTVAAQYAKPTVVRAYPTALRGATANRGTETSVHFNVVQSEAFTDKMNKWYPGGAIPGHNRSFTNLSRDYESTAKKTSHHDNTTRRLTETNMFIIVRTLIYAVHGIGTNVWLIILATAIVGSIFGFVLASSMMGGNLKIPPAWGPEMAPQARKPSGSGCKI